MGEPLTDLDIKRRAAELLQKGRYEEAVEEYQALLGQSKKPNPAILNLIGDIFCKQENYEKGFDAYLRAARGYSDEGLFHNAIAVGKKILRLDRDQVDVYGMLGTLYARQGLGMDCVKFLGEFARRKEQAGEYPAALAAFADACEKLPGFAEIHVVHGDMLEKVDRAEEAGGCYRQAAQAFGDRGRADLAAKWSEKARRAKHPEPEVEEERQVSGLMSLRTLADEPPPTSGAKSPSRTMKRPPSSANQRPAELERRGQFWGRTDEREGMEGANAADEPVTSATWKQFDPEKHPNLPKPPPLPPRGKQAQSPTRTALPASMDPTPLLLDTIQHGAAITASPLSSPTTSPPPAPEAPVTMLMAAPFKRGPVFDFPPSAPTLETPVEEAPAVPQASAAAPSSGVWEITLDAPLSELQSEAPPAPEEDMVSKIHEEPLRGSMRDLDTATADAAALPDPAKLREFLNDTGASPEQAVVIGDDFELVREGGDVFEVIADFREATREILDLDDHQAHYDLGTTYLEMELFDDAVAEFEIASRGKSFALPSQEMLGYCFLRKGQIDLAIRELEKALTLPGHDDRDRLGIHYNLGIACGVTDRENDAIEHFQKILEVDPNFRDTRSRLERLVQNSH